MRLPIISMYVIIVLNLIILIIPVVHTHCVNLSEYFCQISIALTMTL